MKIHSEVDEGVLKVSVELGTSIEWGEIAGVVTDFMVRQRPNTAATEPVTRDLLAKSFRHWGEGSVTGVFTTSWRRDMGKFVVTSRYEG